MTANMSEERNLLSIWSPTGVLVLERTLKPGINTIDVEQELHGIYIYKISNRNQTLGIGRVVFLK